MQNAILLTSHVAGSRIGGHVTQTLLHQAGIGTIFCPTVLFGRHPGRGIPGGGAVSDETFLGLIEGIRAEGWSHECDAIFTGYFASTAQVMAAARLIDEAKSLNPAVKVLVDPIIGDGPANGQASGHYVKAEVAEAISRELIKRADLITPNAYELAWLTGRAIASPFDGAKAAAELGKPCIATSIPVPSGNDQLGVLIHAEGSDFLIQTDLLAGAPNGTGDAFAAIVLTHWLNRVSLKRCAEIATARLDHLLKLSLERYAPDLILDRDAMKTRLPRMQAQRVGAQHPAWVMGLDGAPGGWVGVLIDLNGLEQPRRSAYATFEGALNAPERPHIIAVDMPIGFDAKAEIGGRQCDRLARMRLGPRKSSIFSAPSRKALVATNYDAAQIVNKADGGPGLSKQAYNLFPKLRELDNAMRPSLEGCVHEVHPELTFTLLAGKPMTYSKKTREGRAERLKILEGHGLMRDVFEPHPFPSTTANKDDLVDAGACALTAVRIAEGRALSLPDDPPRDARGLRMAIFA
ncbi:PfkB family carbohydrate kinase [Woodsholea maritima]|uniref:PfkB family carbohydrate kinase n=1 Tax=Woodsholea maritima TaxID=240237 RepID=UPI000367A255|nr:PfkB family carbohydrate kinase [Woodsholea maritima]